MGDGGEASSPGATTGWEGYVGTRGPHAENSHGPKAGIWGAGGLIRLVQRHRKNVSGMDGIQKAAAY